jgi:hypothetical protein
MEIASVVIDKVLASILIVPPLPVTTEPAVTEVAPNTLPTPPTASPIAPLKVVVAEPELISTVGVVAVEWVLIVEPKVMAASVVEIEVFRFINTALL